MIDIKVSIVHQVKKINDSYRITFANGDSGFYNPKSNIIPFKEDEEHHYSIERRNRKHGTGIYHIIKPL